MRRVADAAAHNSSAWFAFATIAFGRSAVDANDRVDSSSDAGRALVTLVPDDAVPDDCVALPAWIAQCIAVDEHVALRLATVKRASRDDAPLTTDTSDGVVTVRAPPTLQFVQVSGSFRCDSDGAAASAVDAMRRTLARATVNCHRYARN